MANIQPFDYQKSTNIEEHNQIVNKVNEIVGVINAVNLDTINSEIADLKTKATATDTEIANIKNKDTQQDTEIDGIDKSLISDVTATFDNPSRELKISVGKKDSTSIDATVVIPSSSETGQYSAGNGISIENYQIAVDTNVVALKTDIPVIPDVTNLTQRVTTLEAEMPTKASVDDVNSKVAIAQGTENAGKVLGIGADGNVTPVNAGGSPSGGDGWEEVDFDNWPTDWADGDRVKIATRTISICSVTPSSWEEKESSNPHISNATFASHPIIEGILKTGNEAIGGYIVHIGCNPGNIILTLLYLNGVRGFNSGNIGKYRATAFNGLSNVFADYNISTSTLKTHFDKMWRKRASA